MSQDNLTDLEAQEVEELDRLMEEFEELVRQGAIASAYETLAQLPSPKTDAGRRIASYIEVMRKYFRACKLYMEGDREEAKNQLQQFLQEAPDHEAVRPLKKLATNYLRIFSTDPREVSPELLQDVGLSPLGYLLQGTRKADAELQDAFNALRLGNESEFQAKIARANQQFKNAEQEFPTLRGAVRAYALGLELALLVEQQTVALSQFDFDLVPRLARRADELSAQMKQLYSDTENQWLISWTPPLSETYRTITVIFADLAKLIKKIISDPVNARHLDTLDSLNDTLQDGLDEMTQEIAKHVFIPQIIHNQLLIAFRRGLRIVKNLRVEIVPSRQRVLSLAGLASAVGFLLVMGITFLLGRFTNANLNPTLVLSLAAFFGLVTGFGYGAIHFRRFFHEVFMGRQGRSDEAGQGNA